LKFLADSLLSPNSPMGGKQPY